VLGSRCDLSAKGSFSCRGAGENGGGTGEGKGQKGSQGTRGGREAARTISRSRESFSYQRCWTAVQPVAIKQGKPYCSGKACAPNWGLRRAKHGGNEKNVTTKPEMMTRPKAALKISCEVETIVKEATMREHLPHGDT